MLYGFTTGKYVPQTPRGGVLFGPDGALYTTTQNAILYFDSDGTLFRLAPPTVSGGSWTGRIVVGFGASNVGAYPDAAVVLDGGSLYGTTSSDNTPEGGCGSVYEATPPASPPGAWMGTAIHNFGGPDGCGSVAPLTVGPNGALYGTTYYGGSGGPICEYPYAVPAGCGVVFRLTPPTSPGEAWTETTIYNFTALNGDGAYPSAGLVMDQNGVLYGTTQAGGTSAGSPCDFYAIFGCGTVFSLTPPTTPGAPWTEAILHAFTGLNGEGSLPTAGLTLNSSGALFGTTSTGGTAGKGTIFAITP